MAPPRAYSITTAVWLLLGSATLVSTAYYYSSRRPKTLKYHDGSTRRMSETMQAVSIPRQQIPLARALGTLTPIACSEPSKTVFPTFLRKNESEDKTMIDAVLTSFFDSARSMTSVTWSTPSLPSMDDITMKMSELYQAFPEQIKSLQESYTRFWEMLTMDEFRQMMEEVSQNEKNAVKNPEILLDANVREGNTLSLDEQAYVNARKRNMVESFAKFIGVDPEEVHEDDLPVVGVASSGGGYRAMIGNAGYLMAMEKTGALDCTMYCAAVSGSTWTLAQYLSPLTNASSENLLSHLRTHAQSHVVNIGRFLGLINGSEQNAKAVMEGIVQRYNQQGGTVSLVDIFGMLLGAVLLTKKEQKIVENKKESTESGTTTEHEGNNKIAVDVDVMLPGSDQKISKQRQYIKDGLRPMPIYCVVRHAIRENQTITDNVEPEKEANEKPEESKHDKVADSEVEELPSVADEGSQSSITEEEVSPTEKEVSEEQDVYQWFELTPFEVGSEELSAWIPTWAFGRTFEAGKGKNRCPEQNLGTITFGSAFTATLAHFYQEVRGLLPLTALLKADSTIKQYEESVTSIHPISPASFPNPFYKLSPTPPAADPVNVRSESIINSPELRLMDAGMDNNIPFYPLLRNGRSVDVIITFDLSADIQAAPYFERAEGWVKRRGVQGWPIGAGWPKKDIKMETQQEDGGAENIDAEKEKEVHGTKLVNETEELKEMKQAHKEDISLAKSPSPKSKYGLGHCTVFASSASETTMDGNGKNEADNNSGTTIYREDINPITVIYFPLIGNDRYDPEYDPQENDITTTWNFVYSPSQVNKLHGLAEANWTENVDQVRQVLRGVWERKKKQREMNEPHAIKDQFSSP
ncbi:acyl transferase/acyl hydrolase/lysophospholipase [Umbelopsis sp. AD052]|nr:acyl transferase/acyl hydrolase/lysophospholipase [Umbelopsis sp. AD052]